ncbi:hypothetical protein EJV47_23560 [Hymenobacter gummosus]|uniref:Lipocalin-like domain-containing protein n=1 Tax=Hymenobacter gummosus TaxID=1776032 RepID=A0A3S0JAT5_9BACT|nr:hypothetical protein [Hymenobacter gummosus]RTQ45814.1 hypothetical protein EJV47_23560 [Hymenobacter gummosus]
MKTLPATLLPLALLLSLAACKKDEDKEPSKTDNLTNTTWKDSQDFLQLNGATGTRATAAGSVNTYQFARDGKLTVTPPSGPASSGTWAFASNETQLVINNGSTSKTYEVFELSKDKVSFGYRYNQTQVQQAVAGGGGSEGQLIRGLILSAGGYTFPAGTPTTPAAQLTSIQWGQTVVPK